MRHFIGSMPTSFTLTNNPTKFKTGAFVTFTDGSSSIGTIIYPLIATRAYGVTYKYLVRVDIDLYMVAEEDLVFHDPFKGVE